MSERNRSELRSSATESKFYLPVGISPSSVASPLKRLRATLFGQRI